MCDNRAYTHRPSGPVAAPLRIPRGAFLCRYVEIDSVRQEEGDLGIKSGMYLLFQGWFYDLSLYVAKSTNLGLLAPPS